MALVGTISGSVGSGGALTSATAVSGTLIIADSPPGSFPALPSGAKLFVEGNISGSSDLRVSGNITGSNVLLSGDLAVNGGDITSAAAALNISAGSSGIAFQSGSSSFATFVSGANGPFQQAVLQASSGKNLLLAAGLGPTQQVVISGSLVEIRSGRSGPGGVDFTTDVGGLAQGYLNIISGSYVAGGVTVTNAAKIVPGDVPQPHDLLVGASATRNLYLSGTSVVANMGNNGFFFQRDGSSYGVIQGVAGSSFTIGSAAGVISMNLVSSGNVTVRLDSDNNAAGHQFQVQDYRGISQFLVGEDGNAEISGSLVVSGSSIQTVTSGTFNLLTTALTGTLNVGSSATNILVGGTVTTSSFQGAAQIDGRSTLSSVTEKMVPSGGSTGTVTFDLSITSIFHVTNPAGDITANFTNVPVTTNRIITPTIILSQSATPRTIIGVQVNSASGSILWANKTTPTATAGQQDIFGFSLIRSGSVWTVLGQLSTYG